MRRCQLQFELVYRPLIAGGEGYESENRPLWLQIYVSHEFRPQQPATLRFDATGAESNESRIVCVPLDGKPSESAVYAPLRDAGGYSFAQVGRQFEPGRASRSASLIFNAYASTITEDGNRAVTRVGSVRVTMTQLMQLLREPGSEMAFRVVQNTNNSPHPISTRGPRADAPLLKGTLMVRRVRIDDCTVGAPTPVTAEWFERTMLLPTQAVLDNETDEQRERIAEVMRDVVIRSLTAFTNRQGDALLPVPTKHFLGHFHCPEWRLAFMFVPAFVYLSYWSDAPTEYSFFANAATVALRRCRLQPLDAADYGRSLVQHGMVGQREATFVRFAVMLVTVFATSMPYLDDFTNANKFNEADEKRIEITEDFKCARLSKADDCEGVAGEALLEAIDVIERMSPRSGTPLDAVLAVTRDFLLLYVPCLSLHAVTNKKAVPASHIDVADDNVPAHTISVLIPYARFEQWLHTDIEPSRLRATQFYRQRQTQLERAPSRLPTLVLDGTARTDACVLPLAEYFSAEERQRGVFGRALTQLHDKCVFVDKVRGITSETRLTNELFASEPELTAAHRANQRDLSDFYKFTVKVQTRATIELGCCDFAAVERHEGGDNQRTYGVYFNDFITHSERVALVPYLHVTPTEMAHMDMLLASEEMVPQLTVSDDTQQLDAEIDRRVYDLRRGTVPDIVAADNEAALLHTRTMVLAARTVDIGEKELVALRRVCALPDVKCVEVDAFRVCDAMGVGDELNVVDVTLHY